MEESKHPLLEYKAGRVTAQNPSCAARRRLPLLVLILLLLAPPAHGAQDPTPHRDLTEMSLEDLMDLEVTSVSRKEQKVSDTASAVYVITQEDIRRSGMTSIPELLRMAPGVHVAQVDANKWAVSIRGFNSRFSDKLLVMIDGRSVYNPLFSGTYWEAQDMMLEDIERIEVVRGPGGTMWGSNAVNGVVNIITKHSQDTQGTVLTVGGGNPEGGFGGVRTGDSAGSDVHYRVYSKYFMRGVQSKPGGGSSEDSWDTIRSGFRLDWDAGKRDSFMFTGNTYDGDAATRVVVPVFRPPFQAERIDDIDFNGSNLLGRWTRKISDTSSTALQFYANWFDRSDVFVRHQRINIFDVDFQHQLELSADNRLIWGFGFRNNSDDQELTQLVSAAPPSRTTRLYHNFVQDEIQLAPNLLLTVGSKFEHNTFTGWEVQPSASLLWDRTSKDTVWLSTARAVRIPARGIHDARINVQTFFGPEGRLGVVSILANPDFQSEDLLAYEAGYRLRPHGNVSIDLAGFYNVYKHLQISEPEEPFFGNPSQQGPFIVPLLLTNNKEGETYGVEAAVRWRIKPFGQVAISYSWFEDRFQELFDRGADPIDSGTSSPGSPRQQFHARWHRQLWSDVELDTAYYCYGALEGGRVPAYHRLDARIGWKASSRVRFSLGLQNLLDNRHPETLPILFDQAAEIRRNIYGKILWQF